jgi:hypothetical protein
MPEKPTDTKPQIPQVPRKLLGLGIASVTAGTLLFIGAFARFEFGYPVVFPAALLILCALGLYRVLSRRMKSWVVFLSLYGFLTSLLFLLALGKIISFSFREFWPIFTLFCGICLIAAGYYGAKRLTFSYLVPAILLTVLGVFFFLFSTDIIQVTFSSFVAKWLPVGLILTGIVLMVLFFARSAIQRALLQPLQDDPDDLRDND